MSDLLLSNYAVHVVAAQAAPPSYHATAERLVSF